MQLAFGRFDTRRSGRLDARELHAALQAVGLDASTGGAAALVARHERGPGGGAAAVDLGAFSALVEQLRAMQLSTSTAELAALRGELGAKERELEALRRELEAARAALGQSRRVPDDVRAALALELYTHYGHHLTMTVILTMAMLPKCARRPRAIPTMAPLTMALLLGARHV